ncbi:hypothetical protein PSm6_52790 [Pseudomonas solani]|uniref:Uncharacterized protein n=1 Tax=Pseudomonas solani TaxID=2731552 RepID=A0ABN6BZD0_9PSED|nr:hypothetical protein PSm6_52790 [Pseudomonas solani]
MWLEVALSTAAWGRRQWAASRRSTGGGEAAAWESGKGLAMVGPGEGGLKRIRARLRRPG